MWSHVVDIGDFLCEACSHTYIIHLISFIFSRLFLYFSLSFCPSRHVSYHFFHMYTYSRIFMQKCNLFGSVVSVRYILQNDEGVCNPSTHCFQVAELSKSNFIFSLRIKKKVCSVHISFNNTWAFKDVLTAHITNNTISNFKRIHSWGVDTYMHVYTHFPMLLITSQLFPD